MFVLNIYPKARITLRLGFRHHRRSPQCRRHHKPSSRPRRASLATRPGRGAGPLSRWRAPAPSRRSISKSNHLIGKLPKTITSHDISFLLASKAMKTARGIRVRRIVFCFVVCSVSHCIHKLLSGRVIAGCSQQARLVQIVCTSRFVRVFLAQGPC